MSRPAGQNCRRRILRHAFVRSAPPRHRLQLIRRACQAQAFNDGGQTMAAAGSGARSTLPPYRPPSVGTRRPSRSTAALSGAAKPTRWHWSPVPAISSSSPTPSLPEVPPGPRELPSLNGCYAGCPVSVKLCSLTRCPHGSAYSELSCGWA